jgi:hypothetical protein
VRTQNNRVELQKDEIDKAVKDKHHRKFPRDFRVEVLFNELSKDDDLDEALPLSKMSLAIPSAPAGSPGARGTPRTRRKGAV